jgi:hypothetical protein
MEGLPAWAVTGNRQMISVPAAEQHAKVMSSAGVTGITDRSSTDAIIFWTLKPATFANKRPCPS